MKTVGSILHDARLAKGLTIEDVEAATKIRTKFLQDIEEDTFTALPSTVYAKGFVKNYAEFLGLSSSEVIAFFRRQMGESGRSSILPKGVVEPLNRSLFQLTPGTFTVFVLSGLVTLFLLYFGRQYITIQTAPVLTTDWPQGGVVVSERKVEVRGKTDPDATVTVNGVSAFVRSDGKFFDQVALEPGRNTLTIVATSRYGKTITVTREVTYQQAQ